MSQTLAPSDIAQARETNDAFSIIFGNRRGRVGLMEPSPTGVEARNRAREAGMSLDRIAPSEMHDECGRCGHDTVLVEHWSCGSIEEGGGYRGQGILVCQSCDAEWSLFRAFSPRV